MSQKQYLMATKWTDMPNLPAYFDRYIKKVDDMPIMDAFTQYTPTAILSDVAKLKKIGDQVYEVNKWTVKDILQHIIDTERVFAYRALCFARNDHTPLPGFEENTYAKNAQPSRRSLDDLIEEWKAVRAGSKALFRSFDQQMLERKGLASASEISVLALGFTLIGHAVHHGQVIEKRYYPLLEKA